MNRATEHETPNIIKNNELFPTPNIVEFSANLIRNMPSYLAYTNKNIGIIHYTFL